MIVGDDVSEAGGPQDQAGPPAMTAAVRRVGDVPLVEVAGEVDLLTSPQLRDTVLAALAGQPPLVVIDLLAVSFFGSAGLAVLIDAQQRAGAQTEIRLVASGPVTVRPLQATGLARCVRHLR
jgi:anti-sigma B factor antagonist